MGIKITISHHQIFNCGMKRNEIKNIRNEIKRNKRKKEKRKEQEKIMQKQENAEKEISFSSLVENDAICRCIIV